jgi:hypothetical protein
MGQTCLFFEYNIKMTIRSLQKSQLVKMLTNCKWSQKFSLLQRTEQNPICTTLLTLLSIIKTVEYIEKPTLLLKA